MAERPEDLNLPNAVVTRIIKDAIPEGVNISKEARLAISKAASVFVLYATSCSNNFALKGKRKTINAQDVLSAMDDMEFEQFIEPLQQCHEAFLEEKNNKKREKATKSAATPVTSEGAGEGNDDDDDVQEVSDSESGAGSKSQQPLTKADQVPADSGDTEVAQAAEEDDNGGSDSSVEMVEGEAD